MTNKTKAVGKSIAFGLCFVVFFLGFSRNAWDVAHDAHHKSFHRTMEGHVLGRIVASRNGSIFSDSGFLGTVQNRNAAVMLRNTLPDGHRINDFNFNGILQYQIYGRELPVDLNATGDVLYHPYTSHSGVQGWMFSLLDQWLPSTLEPPRRLALYRNAMAFLAALAMVVLVFAIYRTVGWVPASCTGLTIACSRWLTVYAPNLYWNLWVFFLPLAIAFAFRGDRGRAIGRRRLLTYGTIAFLTVTCKGLLSGFEFATVACLMPFVPLVFYAVAYRWRPRYASAVVASVFVGVSLAVGLNLTILAVQHRNRTNSWGEAVAYLKNTALKRSHGDARDRSGEISESLNVSVASVVKTYVMGDYLQPNAERKVGATLRLPYWSFLVVLSAASLSLVFSRKPVPRRLKAFHSMTWAALACPLSWYVIFKAHSHIHTMLNFVIWEMPFTLLAPAAVGATVVYWIRTLSPSTRKADSSTGPDGSHLAT